MDKRRKDGICADAHRRAQITALNRAGGGSSNGLVAAWVKRYLEEGEGGLEPRNGNPYAALHRSKSLSEAERLRLIAVKQEVEIAQLKKDIG